MCEDVNSLVHRLTPTVCLHISSKALVPEHLPSFVPYLSVTSTMAHPERRPLGTWAHGNHWHFNFVYSTSNWANSMPNCVYCLQEASSWNWLSCQTHRTRAIWVDTCLKVSPTLPRSALYCRLWLTYFNWWWLFWFIKCSKMMTIICRRVAWNLESALLGEGEGQSRNQLHH